MCQYIPFFSSWACSDNSSDDFLVLLSKGKKKKTTFYKIANYIITQEGQIFSK